MKLKNMSPEEIQTAVDKLEEENANLKKEAADAKTAHAGCEEKITALQSQLDEKNKAIEDLNGVIASAGNTEAAKGGELGTIDVEGKTYQWLKPSFVLPGDPKRHEAKTASVDVAKKVLDIKGQKVLKPVIAAVPTAQS